MKISGPANIRGLYDGTSTGTTTGTEFGLDMKAKSVTKATRTYTPIIALASSVAASKSSAPEDDDSSGEENGSSSGSTRDPRSPFGKGGSGNGSTSPSNKRKKGLSLDGGSGDGCGIGQAGESVENGENGWSVGVNVSLRNKWAGDAAPANHESRGDAEEKVEGEEGTGGNSTLEDKVPETLGNSPSSGEKSKGQKPAQDGNIGAALNIVAQEKLLLGDKKDKVQSDQEKHRQQVQPEQEDQAGSDGTLKKLEKVMPCPRCDSMETKFCYFNNYNQNQPRHFCKKCQRYWTEGGTLRNVPIGSGRRKNKHSKQESRLLGGSGGSGCLDKMDNGRLLTMGVGLPTGDCDMALNKSLITTQGRGLAPGGRGITDNGIPLGLQRQTSSTLREDVASPYMFTDPRTGLGLATDLARVEEGSNMRLLLRDEVGNSGHLGYLGGGGGMDRRGDEAALPLLNRSIPVGHPAYAVPSHPPADMWQRNSGRWESGPQMPYTANGLYNHSGNRMYSASGGGYGSGNWTESCESGQTQAPHAGQWLGPPSYAPAWSQAGGMWNNGGVGGPMNQWNQWKPPSSAVGWASGPQEAGGWVGGGNVLPQTVGGSLKRSAEMMGASFRECGQGTSGVWTPKMLRMEEVGEEVGMGGDDGGRNSAWTRVNMGGVSPAENGMRMGLLRTASVKEVTQGVDVRHLNPVAMARSMMFQEN